MSQQLCAECTSPAWFCELLDKGCSKDPTWKSRNESGSYSSSVTLSIRSYLSFFVIYQLSIRSYSFSYLSGVIYQLSISSMLSVRSYPSVTYQELFHQLYVISQLSISSMLSLRSYLSVLISSRSSALHPLCSSLCSSSEAGVQKEHFSDFSCYMQILLLRHSSDSGVPVWIAIA